MRWSALTQTVFALSLAIGCNGERAALLRGQAYYEDNQYERALSLWRSLERRESQLSASDFARYAYLRGMTDYRLGFHADARHWLALAKVTEQRRPGGLDSAWVPRLDGALADLERETSGMPAGNVDTVQSIEAPVTEAPAVEPPGAPPADALPAAPPRAGESSLPAPAPLPSPPE